MSAPRTVIVVLNWNGRDDTLACLESLGALDPGAHEVLVVDNGSEDGSEAAIREAHPEIPFLQTGSNLGFAGGNNAGIAWALERGADYVLLLNNDTLVEPDFLDRMLEKAESDPRIGVVGASIAYADTPARLWAFGGGRFDVATGWVRHVQRELPERELDSRGTRHFYVTGCTMLLRRAMLEQVGALDTSYFHFCEDVDLCVRAEAAGWRIAVAASARLRHKVSATTRVSSPLFLYYNLRSRLSLVRRHGPPGSPGTLALAKLWLRLWRPALFSGLGISGWKALRRAHRDYLHGVSGPAPSEIATPRRRRASLRCLGIALPFVLLALAGPVAARGEGSPVKNLDGFLGIVLRGESAVRPATLPELLYAMAEDHEFAHRVLERADTRARPLTHRLLTLLQETEVEAKRHIDDLYTVRDFGPGPDQRPPTWSDLRLQGLEILGRIAPREGVGRDLRLRREIERDEISSRPDTYPRPSWVAARLEIWRQWWYEVGMDPAFWLDPSSRPVIDPWLEQLSLQLPVGGVRLFDLLVPLADDPLAYNALLEHMDAPSLGHLVAEAMGIVVLYQAQFDELGVPRRRWESSEGRLVGHTAKELRGIALGILARVCSYVPSGASESEVIDDYARWWRRAHLQARYYRDPHDAPDLSPWLANWNAPVEQGGVAMPHLLREFYVADGFRDLLLDQMGPSDAQLVAELVAWLARDRDDAVASGFITAYRQMPLRPLPGEEGRLVGIPWEGVRAMIREMLRRITGDVGLPEEGLDEITRNQFWFDWWRAHDDEARWYRSGGPTRPAPQFEMQRDG